MAWAFSPIGMAHLKKFGLKTDWRRSFITTDENPFYDSFVSWQFRTLKKRDKLWFGNRPSVYSERMKAPCGDHDRASGEQIGPQNYTLIKQQIMPGETPMTKLKGDKLEKFLNGDKKVFLVCGTLRPETMYGQTNTFVLPTGDYIIVETKEGELWITGAQAARNMAFQDMLNGKTGEVKSLGEVKGWDLLGRKVTAPNAQYKHVYVLPLLTIKMDKATGCVTSVPSDAPDDYAALMDIRKNKKDQKKYYITPEMVDSFEPVSVLTIPPTEEYPELGDLSAVALCKKMKVKNQKDEKKLKEIKDVCYKNGFSKGTMNIGPYKGTSVKEAKDLIKADMIKSGDAAEYWEPEEPVMARTGDRCVVAFTDQWFLKYGEKDWKEAVKNHIDNTMEFYNPKTRQAFGHKIDWLDRWACSREFGLGTKLPNAPEFVIESLSDSTIYMAYYTIVHHLQGNCDFTGKSSKISPKDVTDEVFDFIFLKDKPLPKKFEHIKR
eukprot:UN32916